MVVESIALPKVAGGAREHELPVMAAESAACAVHGAHRRSVHAPVLVFLLLATQVAWLALLGYGAFRFLG
jgi:hypothetical protein